MSRHSKVLVWCLCLQNLSYRSCALSGHQAEASSTKHIKHHWTRWTKHLQQTFIWTCNHVVKMAEKIYLINRSPADFLQTKKGSISVMWTAKFELVNLFKFKLHQNIPWTAVLKKLCLRLLSLALFLHSAQYHLCPNTGNSCPFW